MKLVRWFVAKYLLISGISEIIGEFSVFINKFDRLSALAIWSIVVVVVVELKFGPKIYLDFRTTSKH